MKGKSLENTIKQLFKQYRDKGIPAYRLHDAPHHQEKTPFDFFIYHDKVIIAFDAKECHGNSLNIKTNLKMHQVEALKAIVKHGGIGFFLIYFFKSKTLCKLYANTAFEYILEGKKEIKESDCVKTGLDVIGVLANELQETTDNNRAN